MTVPRPDTTAEQAPSSGRIPTWIMTGIGVVLFAASIWVLHRELRTVDYREVVAALGALPPERLFLAFLFTALNYLVLTGFDMLAFDYIGRQVSRWRVAVASFVGYAISNNVGWSLVSGTSVRYRFYSRWGLTAGELSRIVVFYSGTFWLGLLLLGGWSLAFYPHPGLLRIPGAGGARPLGALLFLSAIAYPIVAAVWRRPIRVGRFTARLPALRTVAWQFVLSAVDWALAAGVLYALLPPDLRLSFGAFVGAFLAAQLLGQLSHVPGGLGVFEGTMIVMLQPYLDAEDLLSSLVLYRIVYYILPLGAALGVLLADEVRLRRHHLARWGGMFGALTVTVAPKLLAVFTFLAGALLLFSGATPAEAGRLLALGEVFPLAVFEASHFLASVVGVGLLLVSSGVARRLDAAYWAAIAALAVGAAATLLKGGDYEEAALLGALLLAFLPSRREFDRRAAFFEARFSTTWVLAVLAVLGASIWLGIFAFQHVEYSDELWWRFALQADAPRFLRASVGATLAVLVFGIVRLLRPAPPEVHAPTDQELARAEEIIRQQPGTQPNLIYLRDKTLLFDEQSTGFIMYGVQGQSWVALGEPVGGHPSHRDLVRSFLERVDDYGGQPVFYQVSPERLHLFADFGLTFAKLGEEAHVPLPQFSLDGADRKPLRLAINRWEKAGGSFRILPPEQVPAVLPRLREVSDQWLASKRAGEKGFSLGFFDPAYLSRFPVAVAELDGEIVAFANLWPGAGGEELSVDLMRSVEAGPKNVHLMDVVFTHLMLWGRERGFQRFNLGMAPLAGLESSAVSPLWTKLGSFVFRHGGAFYNFEGLRKYKAKFDPEWHPRYLAYPGGLSLPRILADVTALVAGGYRRIFR